MKYLVRRRRSSGYYYGLWTWGHWFKTERMPILDEARSTVQGLPEPSSIRGNLIKLFPLSKTNACDKQKDGMKCENVKWKMWWYEEDFECIMKLRGRP